MLGRTKFIRVGETVVNADFIAYVSREGTAPGAIRVATKNPQVYWDFEADSAEAEAILDYFACPDVCLNLCSSDSNEIAYQQFLERGGEASYSHFLFIFGLHQRLVENETPSRQQLEELAKLEHDLKL